MGSFMVKTSEASASFSPSFSAYAILIVFPRTKLFVLLAAFLVEGSNAQQRSRHYSVVSGDTCDGISAKESVSTYRLTTVNAGVISTYCTNLFVGETLCFGQIGQDCSTAAVVEAGDTCVAIADQAGIALDTLLANNPNVNAQCTNIGICEVLCTAATVIVVSPSSTASSAAVSIFTTSAVETTAPSATGITAASAIGAAATSATAMQRRIRFDLHGAV